MSEKITLMVDGQEVAVPQGATIREAALTVGIHTPTLCHSDQMHCGSNCRACVVEVKGARLLVPSCSREVSPGMEVMTNSERVRRARKMVFELLMTEVDTSAAKELNAYASYYGSDPSRFPAATDGAAKERIPILDNPFFARDYAKCIACQRCTQACGEDVQHTFAIAIVGRGHEISVGAGSGINDLTESPCVFCGNCVGVCPTGALSPLPEFEARAAGIFPEEQLTWSPAAGFAKKEAL